MHDVGGWTFEKMPLIRAPLTDTGHWDDDRPQVSWFHRTGAADQGGEGLRGAIVDGPSAQSSKLLHPSVLLLCCGFVSLEEQLESQTSGLAGLKKWVEDEGLLEKLRSTLGSIVRNK